MCVIITLILNNDRLKKGGGFMNYIVFDLEWNQCPYGKENRVQNLPFEIIEIGAVKLNDKLKVIDEFQCYVRPVVYKELHRVTKELLQINMNDLRKGLSFKKAIESFLKWCGKEEYAFCTWGNMDLMELQRNMTYFGVEKKLPFPLFYYDIQKLFSIKYEDGKVRRTLEFGVLFSNFKVDKRFHSALYDARYTAKIMTNIDFDLVKSNYSIDTYVIPDNKKNEISVVYDKYAKYISMGFCDREDLMSYKRAFETKCYVCGRTARKKIRWFAYNTKLYYCLCNCPEHGFMKGKLRIRKDDNGKYYAMKILKLTDETGASFIKGKKEDVRKKKIEKKKREQEAGQV